MGRLHCKKVENEKTIFSSKSITSLEIPAAHMDFSGNGSQEKALYWKTFIWQ